MPWGFPSALQLLGSWQGHLGAAGWDESCTGSALCLQAIIPPWFIPEVLPVRQRTLVRTQKCPWQKLGLCASATPWGIW